MEISKFYYESTTILSWAKAVGTINPLVWHKTDPDKDAGPGNLKHQPDMQRIIHVVNIRSRQEEVYKVIASKSGISNWWSTQVGGEESPGGILQLTFTHEFSPHMKITLLNEPKVVRWECVFGHDPWLGSTFSFELREDAGMTQLTFIQHYVTTISDEDYGIYNYNWGYYLQSLKQYCETGKGKPHDRNHK